MTYPTNLVQQPKTPAVNAGVQNVYGMQMQFTPTVAAVPPVAGPGGYAGIKTSGGTISVTDGQCRDITNTNDIIVSTASGVTAINLSTIGQVNGIDTLAGSYYPGFLDPTQLLYIYAIASSDSLLQTPPASAPAVANQTINVVNPASSTGVSALSLPGDNVRYPAGFLASFQGPVPALNSAGTQIGWNPPAPVLPSGYDMYRRIGAVKIYPTVNNTHLVCDFTQVGNGLSRMVFNAIEVFAASNFSSAAFSSINLVDITTYGTLTSPDTVFNTPICPPVSTQMIYTKALPKALVVNTYNYIWFEPSNSDVSNVADFGMVGNAFTVGSVLPGTLAPPLSTQIPVGALSVNAAPWYNNPLSGRNMQICTIDARTLVFPAVTAGTMDLSIDGYVDSL